MDGQQKKRRRAVLATGAIAVMCALLAFAPLAEEASFLETLLPARTASSLQRIRASASSLLAPRPKMTPIEEWLRFDHGALRGRAPLIGWLSG